MMFLPFKLGNHFICMQLRGLVFHFISIVCLVNSSFTIHYSEVINLNIYNWNDHWPSQTIHLNQPICVGIPPEFLSQWSRNECKEEIFDAWFLEEEPKNGSKVEASLVGSYKYGTDLCMLGIISPQGLKLRGNAWGQFSLRGDLSAGPSLMGCFTVCWFKCRLDVGHQ